MRAIGIVEAVMTLSLCAFCSLCGAFHSFWEARGEAEVAWPGVREVVPAADRHCRAALAFRRARGVARWGGCGATRRVLCKSAMR